MAMTVGSGSSDDEVLSEINTTPLIDVMLVLLIMLIITIPVQTHAVKLDLPAGQPPVSAAPPPEVVRLDIDFDGTILWNDEVVSSQTVLDQRLHFAAAQPVQPEIHLRPNRLVRYGTVAAVMATAQRLGVSKIGIVGHEQFLD